MTARRRWTRDELLVVINFYHKLTFGQMHARQLTVLALAKALGRGANSVAMKLCNFASLYPALKMRGIRGLSGASALDRAVWNEFHSNLESMVPASEEAVRELFKADESSELDVVPREGIRVQKGTPFGSSEVLVSAKQRRGQEYFRVAVINNFGGHCGITQLSVRPLLVASHILPWSAHPAERWNVRNGFGCMTLHLIAV